MKKLLLTVIVALIATISFGQQTYKAGFFLNVHVEYDFYGAGELSQDAMWFVTMINDAGAVLVHKDGTLVNENWIEDDSYDGYRHYKVWIPLEFSGTIQVGGFSTDANGCYPYTGYNVTQGIFNHFNNNADIYIDAVPQ
ncbi:MAG: hypothetical protein JEZ03_16540 [Bacteroidales bacterium]|nr:hypothetical protein [Bacteroidales bacterium]